MHFSLDFLPAFQPKSGRKPTNVPAIQHTQIIPKRTEPTFNLYIFVSTVPDELLLVFTEERLYGTVIYRYAARRVFWTRNGKIYRDPAIEEENEKSVKGVDDRRACERYRLESTAINAPFPLVGEMVSVSGLVIKITRTINRRNA